MLKKVVSAFVVTGFTAVILALYLSPFLYMIFTSLKTTAQMAVPNSPIWPAKYPTYKFNGENKGVYTLKVNKSGTPVDTTIDMSEFVGKELGIYLVPQADGTPKELALLKGFQ